ncbi:uncharacterized protein LOC131543237 [Onychostoma macrolepis]|uniref:Uncharacterized protein n=1 Tax=Onychostoma macrolepis TaxID=369639 RepID=A0A7J6CVM7_9TELE|nr:uncharacterized protein LOC131543237 [Onychostoma macrolepis]KAF4111398.1 hypothetical protein G5714_008429 [Onychostoma macrolepis]
MSLQYYLRLALVGLTLSVVGCLPEVSVGSSSMPLGDVTDDSKIKIQGLESFKSVNPPIENPIRGSLQRNIEQFNSKYQLPWIKSASDNQRKDVNAKTPSFSPTDTRASADVIYSVPNKVQSNINSRNNPVELSSAKFNDEIDAKRSYAFQTVQQEQNPLDFKGSQTSSINLAPRLVRKKGGMHAANVHRSGSFGYQHISKSEMHSGSSRPLGLNEPYLRETIPTNYKSRSSTVNHNIRLKSDGNMLLDHFLQNKGQNQNVPRRIVPANTSPSIVTANQQKSQPLPQVFSAGTGIISQISYENMRDVALSKVFKPPTIPTPISPAFKRSNSNGSHSILPFKKSQLFSSQHDHVKLSNSERVASPKASLQSSFEYGNTKSATSSYTFKNIQLTQNRGQSSQNVLPIQTFHNQKKYDNLATGISFIRPSVINNARSSFPSDKNSAIQMSELLKLSKQSTNLTPQMQFAKNTMLFSQRDKNINLPDPTNHSLRKPSQHNTRNRMHLNSFGQSTVQSLSVKHYPAPSLVPGNTMKSVYSVTPSVSGTQGTSKNSGTSSSRNRPYYLTSKKPYAFKGFTFVPTLQTSLQKSEMHSGQKPLLKSSSNVQYAPARPHTAQSALTQKPLIQKPYGKMPFQFKDIESSQEKQPYWDQTDSFDNGPQRESISSVGGASNPMSDALKHHVLRGQAVAMKTSLSGTNTTNNGAVDKVQSKTSPRWTSSRLASAQHTESNQDEFPAVRFLNSSFFGSNLNKASIKSTNSHKSPTSELILPSHKSSLMNKVTGYPQIHNAVIQPLRRYSLKERERVLNPTKEIKNTNSAGIPQSNTNENYSHIRLRPTSSVVIGRQDEVTQERKSSEENSNHQSVYAIPTSQSATHRSANINSHKTNSSAKLTFQSPIYRSAMKPSGKANILQANAASDWRNETSQISEADINLSAVGVSQALSNFVIGTVYKTSTKSNLNMSSTKSGLNNYKPVRFSDITGSASFTNIKPHSADTTAKEEVDLESDQNRTNSTSVMEGSFKELVFGSSSMISALQNEMDKSAVDLRVPELMPTAAIDFTTQSKLSFTEEHTQPQPTVYSSESQPDPGNHTTATAEDIDPFYEGMLIPNTTLLVKRTAG